MNKQLTRVAKMYERRMKEMVPIIYASFATALKTVMNAEYDDILDVLATTQELWERNKSGEIDIIEECFEVTGIDIMTEQTADEFDISEGDRI